jgi:hypothetical protein
MSSYYVLPADLERAVTDELAAGERIVWGVQPLARRFLLQTLPVVVFGVPWTAFSVFWTVMAAGGVASAGAAGWWAWIFPLWGVPFVLVGLAMLSAPYGAWRGARRTLYLVTDRRALAFTAKGRAAIEVRAFAPDALGALRRVQRPDGSGDLFFARDEWRDSDGDRRTADVGFTAVPDVRAAEEAVRHLAASVRAGVEEPVAA